MTSFFYFFSLLTDNRYQQKTLEHNKERKKDMCRKKDDINVLVARFSEDAEMTPGDIDRICREWNTAHSWRDKYYVSFDACEGAVMKVNFRGKAEDIFFVETGSGKYARIGRQEAEDIIGNAS